jgi:carbon storage regulator
VNLWCAHGAAQEDERMLVLSRKVGERIRISGDIVVVVTAIQGDRIKIGIEAPKSVRVLRGELREIRPATQPPS